VHPNTRRAEIMSRNTLPLILIILLMARPVSGSSIVSPPEFKMECVGRSLLSLPRDAEVAAMLPDDFRIELEGGVAQPAFRFLDGEFAASNAVIYGGSLVVTHKISLSQQNDFLTRALETRKRVSSSIAQERSGVDDPPSVYEHLSTENQIGSAWRVNGHYIAYFSVGEHSVLWTSSATDNDSSELLHDFRNLRGGLQPRPMFTLPDRQGVCLPNIFIADDGKTYRSVRTAFRMKSHPDFLLIVQDSKAVAPSAGRKSPAESLTEFWEQFEYRPNVRNVRSAWHLPKTRPMRLGERAATASLVRITRNSGVVDIGYLAIAPGTPGPAIDIPEIRIFAVRDAALAKQKGVKPIDEEEFVSLVEKIAKTVRHLRPGT
jgi:hypothetical protein